MGVHCHNWRSASQVSRLAYETWVDRNGQGKSSSCYTRACCGPQACLFRCSKMSALTTLLRCHCSLADPVR